MSFVAVAAIGAGASVLGGIFGAVSAGKAKRDAEAKEKVARAEMNRLNNTEGKNYSFYKGNKGTTNLTFGEHFIPTKLNT